jgi:hypothetical protein
VWCVVSGVLVFVVSGCGKWVWWWCVVCGKWVLGGVWCVWWVVCGKWVVVGGGKWVCGVLWLLWWWCVVCMKSLFLVFGWITCFV